VRSLPVWLLEQVEGGDAELQRVLEASRAAMGLADADVNMHVAEPGSDDDADMAAAMQVWSAAVDGCETLAVLLQLCLLCAWPAVWG
jgi:hypothetical protein